MKQKKSRNDQLREQAARPDKPAPEERDYAEYEFDPAITEHEDFTVGDMVSMVDDDPNGMFSADEQAQVVGFSNIEAPKDPAMAAAFGQSPNARTAIYVLLDGTDEPIEVKPEYMEVQ